MTIDNHIRRVGQLANRNAPVLLTAVAITGVAATAYLAAKASWNAREAIQEEESQNGVPDDEDVNARTIRRAKLVWKLYIPPAVAGTATIGSVVLASRSHSKRTAAAVSAYAITEKAFVEYKGKVIDELGKHKEQKIRDEMAEDKLSKSPVSTQTVIAGSGTVLCCELYTKRYFMSDMETLRKAQNDVNANVVTDLYVTLDTFYEKIGLQPTSHSGELGWDSDKLMELEFTSVISEDGRPCLAFEYNYVKPI